ncbi:neuromedin-U receptor 1 [Lampris incognitus]|uniref:neuromedin-U receptor 1 n=1 Tax=Lampris incognitus TaxID=2546036 RepID=UPI0024B5B4BE|nr:neuromedin-U receptor 1 [Lampris incognitus]
MSMVLMELVQDLTLKQLRQHQLEDLLSSIRPLDTVVEYTYLHHMIPLLKQSQNSLGESAPFLCTWATFLLPVLQDGTYGRISLLQGMIIMVSSHNCSLELPADRGDWGCLLELNCGNLTSGVNGSSIEMVDACLTEEEYLEKYLGPRRSSVFLPVCLTYLLIFLVGAMGNVLTCTVISRNKVMWTPTNYYLFSLAVSDLLVLLLGMPLELYEMWQNYPFLLGKGGCYFKTFLFETVCFASILNVTALSVERYIAVVHPLRAKYVVTRTHAKRVILTVWGLSVLCAVPNTSLHGISTLPSRTFGLGGNGNPDAGGNGNPDAGIPDSAICMLVKPRWIYNLTIQVTTLLFFVLPMLTISILYMLIGLQLKREKMLQAIEAKSGFEQGSFCNLRTQQQKARRRQVTKMLFVLVVVFGICWAPFHTDRLMWSFISDWTEEHLETFQYVHIISGVFFYLSSAVNPILYNLMSTRFREMFKDVMCHRPRRPAPRKHSLSVTRVTLRSTLSDTLPSNSAAAGEGEVKGGSLIREKEDKTTFACQ